MNPEIWHHWIRRFLPFAAGQKSCRIGKRRAQPKLELLEDRITPTISINDVTVAENVAGGQAIFTVSLSAASANVVQVNVASMDGTATSTAPIDFAAVNTTTLTFEPGETTKMVNVAINNDAIDEFDENFTLRLSNPINDTILDDTGVGTITDDDPLPVFNIDSPSVSEAAGTLMFTVTLNGATEKSANVSYESSDGTANSPNDYTATGQNTLTFRPGETAQSFTVSILEDNLDEDDETIIITLFGAGNATINVGTGTGIILDNDPLPSLTIADFSLNENGGNADFVVTLTGPTERVVTVDFATADGTAESPDDYVPTNGTLTFAVGETSKTIPVTVVNDMKDEDTNETFTVTLSGATNGNIVDGTAIGTIVDDDPPPKLTVDDVSVNEDAGAATFTVTLTGETERTVTVNVASADGTATSTAPIDFNALATTTLTFAPGETSKTVNITIIDDNIDEIDETYTVNLSNPTNSTIDVGKETGTGTIVDNDAEPTLAIDSVTVDEGAGTAQFTVTLTGATEKTVMVDFATANDTAIEPDDFTVNNGTLTFAPGETTKTIDVVIIDDSIDEDDEMFTVNLANPINATIMTAIGTGTINDNDAGPTLAINDIAVDEDAGTATFTVTLTGTTQKVVTVDVATSNNTAVEPGDYTAKTETLTFAVGETTMSFVVTIIDDNIDEFPEFFNANLSNATNATISDDLGVATINDNDPLATLAIDSVTVDESDGTATFTVTLTGATEKTVNVDYATVNGSATSDGTIDFTATSGTLTFAPGETTKTIDVTINEDDIDEIDESFTITLSNVVNAAIATGTGTGTILDNDDAPELTVNDVTVGEADGTATLSLTITGRTEKTVTFGYTTQNGTAESGSDYVFQSGSFTFNANQITTPTVSVLPLTLTIIDDADVESDMETFSVLLSSPNNVTIGDDTGEVTIIDDDPKISIDDVTVDEDAGTATFTVSLSAPDNINTVMVDYTTVSGTATGGSDFDHTNGTLSFAPGVTTQTIVVNITDDLIDEDATEDFTVVLSNPVNATIGDGTGIGTINDNDDPPTLSVDDVDVDEDAGTATFTVTLSSVSGLDVMVDVTTADDTAFAPGDYTAVTTPQTLTIAAGNLTQTFTVTINDDNIDEFDEPFFVNLANPVNATIANGQGVGTIIDNDAEATLAIDDVTVSEGDGTATFTVTLTGATEKTVTVDYATADFTAGAPSDYLSTNGSLTLAPGETTKSISVTIVDDNIEEDDLEFFFVDLSSPTNATFTVSGGVGTIIDDDPMVSINDVTVNENDGLASFTVSLTIPSAFTVTVDYSTANGSALVGSDYIFANGTVSFAPGQTSKTISVVILDNFLDEPDSETFFINLASAVNATIDDGQGVGTIIDDDATPELTISNVSVAESAGTATFTVFLSAASAQTVTVDYATANGTATAPADYGTTNGTVTFAPGQTFRTFTVSIAEDVIDEADETFNVNLSSATNAVIADNTGIGTIVDNDDPPTLSIDDVSVDEDAGTATFTVTLAGQSEKTVTVDYATANGTATAGADYSSTNGTLTFNPGTTTQTITVTIVDDILVESDETFLVNLSNAASAIVQDGQGLGTIVNDDTAAAQLATNRNFFVDSAGLYEGFFSDEKWLRGQVNQFGQTWYFLRPNGNLFEWDGKKGLGGNLLAALDAKFFEDPEMLVHASKLAAANPGEVETADQTRKFYRSSIGNYYFNLYGGQEKWIKGQIGAKSAANQNNPWYFILIDGTVHEWSGTPGQLTGTMLSISADTNLYRDPSLLTEAFQDVTVNSNGLDQVRNFHFSRANQSGQQSVRNLYENLSKTSDEKWFLGDVHTEGNNPWYFILPTGQVFAWDGTPGTASGTLVGSLGANAWDNIERVVSDFHPVFSQAQTQQLVALDSQLSLFRASNDGNFFFNLLGAQEKRVRGKINSFGNPWYLILQTGAFLEWNGSSSATGNQLATLPPEVYRDPLALVDAFADGSVLNDPDDN